MLLLDTYLKHSTTIAIVHINFEAQPVDPARIDFPDAEDLPPASLVGLRPLLQRITTALQ